MDERIATLKKQSERSLNLMGVALGFGLIYWILEAVRDVVGFGKGDLLHRLFRPDSLSFWTRLLAVCILLLFGTYAEVLESRIREGREGKPYGVKIILIGLLFSLAYWLLESVRQAVLTETSVWSQIFLPDSLNLWIRLLAVFVIVLLSLYMHNLRAEQFQIDTALRKERDRLYTAVERSLVEISRWNNELRIENESLKDRVAQLERRVALIYALAEARSEVIRSPALTDMLTKVCGTVSRAGFALVAIGFRDGGGFDVTWSARGAQDARYLDLADLPREDYELERWPVGQTLKTGVPVVTETLDPQFVTHWTNLLAKRGIKGVVSLPIQEKGKTTAALVLFMTDPPSEELDRDALKVFTEDLGMAISQRRMLRK